MFSSYMWPDRLIRSLSRGSLGGQGLPRASHPQDMDKGVWLLDRLMIAVLLVSIGELVVLFFYY
jgi:hypothetical protein